MESNFVEEINIKSGLTKRFDKDTKIVTITIPATENLDDNTGIILGDLYLPIWMHKLLSIRTFVQKERKGLK